jgi:hypothetical protein
MIRFMIRLTFWGCLIVAVLPGARNSGVYDGQLGFEAVGRAFQATILDLSNFCSRNSDVCQTSIVAFSKASATAKDSLLAAYHGVRGQYEQPDRDTMTGSIKSAEKQ